MDAKVEDYSSQSERRRVASFQFFPYAVIVKRPLRLVLRLGGKRFLRASLYVLCAVAFACCGLALFAHPRQMDKEAGPAVTKVEPPNWWVGLTPEVMLLLSGHDLEATHIGCNLPTLRGSRTQSTAGGYYLFVWLKIGADTKSGTAVCRRIAPQGTTSFELPLPPPAPTML